MRHYKGRILSGIIVLIAILAVGCNDTNYEIGSNYLPDSQVTTMGSIDLWDDASSLASSDDRYFSTKLYRSTRISSANLSRGLFGVQRDEVFGERRSGFFSQYTPGYYLDDEGFGYEPIVDSVLVFLYVTDFSGDTTLVRTYNVYEVVDDSFLQNSADTIFSVSYDYPEGTFSETPVFTFDYPDQDNQVYTTSTYVRARIETAGVDLLARLMLKEGEDGSQITYKYYNSDYDFDDFVDAFKGLYIAPASEELPSTSGDDGATYSVNFTDSGFAFYGRSRYEDDPSIIADTIAMTYVFRDENIDDVGGVTVNSVKRDYSMSLIDIDNVSTNERPIDNTTSTIRVEGMGGVLTQLTLGRALFEEFERAIEAGDDDYQTIFFNVAKLMIYVESADEYDVPMLLTPSEADEMMNLPTRLGLYDVYSTYYDDDDDLELEAAVDYDYYSETVYSYVSDFDGSLNRSLGCYVMNIPFEMQERWTEYVEAKAEAGGDASKIDWAEQEWTRMYIGPLASDLFSPRYVSLQGEADGLNSTPIRLNITYTLLK